MKDGVELLLKNIKKKILVVKETKKPQLFHSRL